MTWPTVAVNTTNADASTDSPASFRTDVLDALTKLNQMMAHVSTFAATLLDDIDAATARTTLGLGTAATQASTAFQAALGYTAANDGSVVHLTGNETVGGIKTFTSQPVLPQASAMATAVATTSGTSIDFTGIPTWVKRITVSLNGVSTNGTSPVMLQIGSGSVQTTGYAGSATYQGASTALGGNGSNGLYVDPNITGAAATLRYGIAVLVNMGSNLWAMSSVLGRADAFTHAGGSTVTLSGTLDRVRLTTSGGSDTFDAGSVNILWE